MSHLQYSSYGENATSSLGRMNWSSLPHGQFETGDVMSLYCSRLNARLSELKHETLFDKLDNMDSCESSDKLDVSDIVLLEKIIKIKGKLVQYKDKIKTLEGEYTKLQCEKDRLESTKVGLVQFMALYGNQDGIKETDEKMGDKEMALLAIGNELDQKISVNSVKLEQLSGEIGKTANKIKTLKTIITEDPTTDATQDISVVCTICDENKIRFTLNPCGHTFCDTCAGRLQSYCFTCRSLIDGKIKMYYD